MQELIHIRGGLRVLRRLEYELGIVKVIPRDKAAHRPRENELNFRSAKTHRPRFKSAGGSQLLPRDGLACGNTQDALIVHFVILAGLDHFKRHVIIRLTVVRASRLSVALDPVCRIIINRRRERRLVQKFRVTVVFPLRRDRFVGVLVQDKRPGRGRVKKVFSVLAAFAAEGAKGLVL